MDDMVISVAKSLLFGFGSAAVLYGAWQFARGVWSGYVNDIRAKESRIAELEFRLKQQRAHYEGLVNRQARTIRDLDSMLQRMAERGTNIYGGQN